MDVASITAWGGREAAAKAALPDEESAESFSCKLHDAAGAGPGNSRLRRRLIVMKAVADEMFLLGMPLAMSGT